MQTFSVTVKHDQGFTLINVTAPDMVSAIGQVILAENCPERAIVKIERGEAKFIRRKVSP